MCIKSMRFLETLVTLSPRIYQVIGNMADKLAVILSVCHAYLNKCSVIVHLAAASSSFLWTLVRVCAVKERDQLVLAIQNHWKSFTG